MVPRSGRLLPRWLTLPPLSVVKTMAVLRPMSVETVVVACNIRQPRSSRQPGRGRPPLTRSSDEAKRRRRVLLAACDVYRPAVIQQLEILGKSVDVDVFAMGTDADPDLIAGRAV